MAKFEVLTTSFIGNKLVHAGEFVEIDPKVMKPGSNLKAVGGAKAPAAGDKGDNAGNAGGDTGGNADGNEGK